MYFLMFLRLFMKSCIFIVVFVFSDYLIKFPFTGAAERRQRDSVYASRTLEDRRLLGGSLVLGGTFSAPVWRITRTLRGSRTV